MSLNLRSLLLLVVVSVFLSACSNSQESDENNVTIPSEETTEFFGGYESDAITFIDDASKQIMKLNSNGEVSKSLTPSDKSKNIMWENKISVLKGICITSERSTDQNVQENEIVLVSPDGSLLGSVDETWEPEISPSGMWAAIACGNDGMGTTLVVSDVDDLSETSNENMMDDWSRESSAKKSDVIEVFLMKLDGSRLHRLTYNDAGDWLPRWDSSGEWLLVESNRDAQSDIFLHLTNALSFTRLTSKEFQDKSPAWSIEQNFIAYQSDESGYPEIVFRNLDVENIGKFNEKFLTGQKGIPIPQP
tara:strand:- start:974 stop:1888 length:915 start_codon:yes stop_codon:yes gene_type:complete